jgi:hypothetical protein
LKYALDSQPSESDQPSWTRNAKLSGNFRSAGESSVFAGPQTEPACARRAETAALTFARAALLGNPARGQPQKFSGLTAEVLGRAESALRAGSDAADIAAAGRVSMSLNRRLRAILRIVSKKECETLCFKIFLPKKQQNGLAKPGHSAGGDHLSGHIDLYVFAIPVNKEDKDNEQIQNGRREGAEHR